MNWQDRTNPQSGGAEIHLHEVFSRLAGRGHDVDLLCSGYEGAAPRDRLDGLEVHRVGRRYTFPLHARRHFVARLLPRDPDVVVEDLNKIPLFTPRWSAVPVVALVHHLFGTTAFREATVPVAAATWLLERTIPRVYRRVPVVAVSESTRHDLVERGLRDGAIEVVPNGIDLERYHPDPSVEPFAEPTLLYLGRLKRYKGVDLVLRAVARLRDEGVAVRFLVGGRGDDGPRLEALARSLEIGDRVEFLGFVDEDRKRELFRRAWIHVLTSPKEGWGITVLEAGACGTPSVASDAPGLRESVRDGETGVLVDHGDVPALAGALRRLIHDDALRTRLGRGAAAFARGFSWERAADGIEAALRRRVAGPPGRA